MSDSTATDSPRSRGKRQRSAESMVEQAALLTFGVLRVGVVIQMAATAVVLWFKSEMPLGSWVMTAVAALWSIVWFAVVIRRGSFIASSVWWGVVDYVVGVLALVVTSVVLPREWLVGTWHAWAYAYTIIVAATVPAWLQSRYRSFALGIGMAAVYVATVLPGNGDLLVTIVVNAGSFVIFVAASAILCSTTRHLAHDADEDRADAIRLAARLEQARYRFHIHNATGLLAQLARDDTPAELLPSLRMQALQESNRLRHDVLVPPNGNLDDVKTATTLENVALASIADFGHLPIEVRTTLARNVPLHADEAVVLQSALISLLYNVQFHAHASEVVVHADCAEDSWEVSVCDDGVGFDPERVEYGFGLQTQVFDSLTSKGMTVQIASRPGEGTCVVIRGPRHGDR